MQNKDLDLIDCEVLVLVYGYPGQKWLYLCFEANIFFIWLIELQAHVQLGEVYLHIVLLVIMGYWVSPVNVGMF